MESKVKICEIFTGYFIFISATTYPISFGNCKIKVRISNIDKNCQKKSSLNDKRILNQARLLNFAWNNYFRTLIYRQADMYFILSFATCRVNKLLEFQIKLKFSNIYKYFGKGVSLVFTFLNNEYLGF